VVWGRVRGSRAAGRVRLRGEVGGLGKVGMVRWVQGLCWRGQAEDGFSGGGVKVCESGNFKGFWV